MKRVFFIDDDSEDREIFHDVLNELNLGIEYQEARDGQEALDMISNPDFAPPDLIFVDLNMPRISGLEFIIKVRQIEGYEKVPTYVYTTSASPQERVNCITAGASGYIIKHLRSGDLRKELNDLMLKLNLT